MPKALPIDWTLAQSLYVCGVSAPEIARRLNVKLATVRKRRERHGWRQLKAACVAAAQEKAVAGRQCAQAAGGSSNLAARSARVRELLTADVEASALALQELAQCKNAAGFRQRQEGVNKLTDAAALVFGWDAESTRRTVINVERMEVGLAALAAQQCEPPPALDVESAPQSAAAEPKSSL